MTADISDLFTEFVKNEFNNELFVAVLFGNETPEIDDKVTPLEPKDVGVGAIMPGFPTEFVETEFVLDIEFDSGDTLLIVELLIIAAWSIQFT